MGSGGVAPHILNLSTRWGWVGNFVSWLLFLQGRSPWHPVCRRLDGHQSWSGYGGKKEKSLPLLEI